VEGLNLTPFLEKYNKDGMGHVAYHPAMIVTVMLYSYCMGERSSRKIEKLCQESVPYRVAAVNQMPDHTTLCRFRKDHEKAIEPLFIEVLRLCKEAGLVKVGVVALDGTKMGANASLAANRTHENIEKEVKRMLSEAAAKDEEEDRLYGKDLRGDELPMELADPKSRMARLRECKARLEKEAEEAAQTQRTKIEKREKEEKVSGKKHRGRKPKDPPEGPDKDSKANVTDPESRIMKTASRFIQGYNAQAMVTENQIIIAAEVTQEENDKRQLLPMIAKTQENIQAAGIGNDLQVVLADAGYCSENNFNLAKPEGPELIVATQKDWKERQEQAAKPAPRGRIPSHLTATERMERKLKTKRGKALYKKRGKTVEPVFGQIKGSQNTDRFMRRGTKACDSEWKFMCIAHNVLKLWRHMRNEVLKALQSIDEPRNLAFAPG
jgi:transposase